MNNPELNKKLIKYATAIKQAAGELVHFLNSSSNEGIGAEVMEHMQNLAGLDPGSAEWNSYVNRYGIPSVAANFLWKKGREAIEYGLDPKLMEDFTDEQGNINPSKQKNKVLGSNFVRGLNSDFRSAFNIPDSFTDLFWGNPLDKSKQLGALYGVLSRTPTWQAGSLNIPTAVSEAKNQAMIGALGQFRTNTPLSRQAIANMGIGFLRNRINHYVPKTNIANRAINSLGQFAVGLASMMPGYESASNWLINNQYGDSLEKARANQISTFMQRLPAGYTPQQHTVAPVAQPKPTPVGYDTRIVPSQKQ